MKNDNALMVTVGSKQMHPKVKIWTFYIQEIRRRNTDKSARVTSRNKLERPLTQLHKVPTLFTQWVWTLFRVELQYHNNYYRYLLTYIKRGNLNKPVFLKNEMIPQKVFEPIVPGIYIGLRVLWGYTFELGILPSYL